MSDKSVAIIGGGIFGCMIALSLARSGASVTIFERRHSIMLGASKNNQNRLHLGFHYPRDINTAQQCINGFNRFIQEFPEAIRHNTSNAYYIATNGSLTTPEDYLRFCNTMGLSYSVLDLSRDEPVKANNVSLGLLCEEVIYDANILTQLLLTRLKATNITLKCNTEISSIAKKSCGFELALDNKALQHFDAVVNCTYGDINRLTSNLGYPTSAHQYEYTIVPIVESNYKNIGLTVMDGPFMTFLPYGKSQHSLLYHVAHSVIDTIIDNTMPKHWLNVEHNPFTKINSVEIFENMKRAAMTYFPALADIKLVGFLHGPRMVLKNCNASDARPSLVNDYGGGYVTVFSGKVDHCIPVADNVSSLLIP